MNPVEHCETCNASEGSLHEWDCAEESCSFCAGRLVDCDCPKERRRLRSPAHTTQYDHLPKEVYEDGLSDEQEAAWKAMVGPARKPFQPNLWRGHWTGQEPGPRAVLFPLAEAANARAAPATEGAGGPTFHPLPRVE